VTRVDEDAGKVKMELGRDQRTGAVMETPWMPIQEIAMGGIKTSFMPRVGEQISASSETGDFTDAIAGFSIPSNKNARPPGKSGEGWITADGDVSITIKAGEIKLQVGETYLKIAADGWDLVGPGRPDGDWQIAGLWRPGAKPHKHFDHQGRHK
jgi:phage baseplate assembly protein gpV